MGKSSFFLVPYLSMVSTQHREKICLCFAFIILLRLAGCSFFHRHAILCPFFEEQIHFLDDTLKVLLDPATPPLFVGVFLDDAVNSLPWSLLPSCLSVLTGIWQSWRRRHPLSPHLQAALFVFQRRFSRCGHRSVPTIHVYDCFDAIPPLTFWTEDDVNKALQDEAAVASEIANVASSSAEDEHSRLSDQVLQLHESSSCSHWRTQGNSKGNAAWTPLFPWLFSMYIQK